MQKISFLFGKENSFSDGRRSGPIFLGPFVDNILGMAFKMRFTNQMSNTYNFMVRKITSDEHSKGRSAVTTCRDDIFIKSVISSDQNLPRKCRLI